MPAGDTCFRPITDQAQSKCCFGLLGAAEATPHGAERPALASRQDGHDSHPLAGPGDGSGLGQEAKRAGGGFLNTDMQMRGERDSSSSGIVSLRFEAGDTGGITPREAGLRIGEQKPES